MIESQRRVCWEKEMGTWAAVPECLELVNAKSRSAFGARNLGWAEILSLQEHGLIKAREKMLNEPIGVGRSAHIRPSPAEAAHHLQEFGFVILTLPRCFSGLSPLYEDLDARQMGCGPNSTKGLKYYVKNQAGVKRRLQFRRRKPVHGEAGGSPVEACFRGLEAIVERCFAEVLTSIALPHAEVNARLFPPKAGRTKSVLNAMLYLDGGSGAEEPWCREHADPGLLTVLARSDLDALQLRLPEKGRAALLGDPSPGTSRPEPGEDTWYNVEPVMDAAAAAAGPGFEAMLILPGYSLERLSGGALKACIHRVPRSSEAGATRRTAAFELRPTVDIWASWSEEAASGGVEGEGSA